MPVGISPIYKILHEGVDITDRFNDQVTNIKVDLTVDGSGDTLAITIDDRDWRIASPEVGAWLEIYLGYKEVGFAQMGKFEISEVKYEGIPKQITITGASFGVQNALKAPAIKHYEDKTLGNIIGEIAKSAGVMPRVHSDLASIKIPFLNQITSPLHLLQELQRRFDATAKFENGQLVVTKRDAGTAVNGSQLATVVLRPEHFQNWSVRHSARSAFSGVRAAWWDRDQHELKWVSESASALIHIEGGGEALPFARLGRWFASKEEAQAAAKAQVGALRRATGEANLVLVKGDPWIRAEANLVIEGMRDGVNGSYTIDTASHSFTKDAGLTTTILCKPGNAPEPNFLGEMEYLTRPDGFRKDPATGRATGPV